MPELDWRWRWVFLLVAAAAAGAAGTYQFIWSSIRTGLVAQFAMDEQTLGSVFTVYVVCQTLSQFPAGWFRDRFGPRIPLAVGAVLITAGYLGTGLASASWHVFAWYAVGGVGAGVAFTVAVNTPVKWFDERRGLATGLVTMAYGGVSVLFIPSVRAGLATDFVGTLAMVGVATGLAAFVGVFVLRDPTGTGDGAGSTDVDPATALPWTAAIRTWQFWLMYLMLVVVNAVGLMIISKAVTATQQFGFGPAVATATASIVAIGDSAGIVSIGGLSDRFNRERTMAATVTVCGVATGLATLAAESGEGMLFVALLGAAAFFRSPVFAIVPSLAGEYYGLARSSENYAALYTSKVWGGVGGGVAASVLIATVGWSNAFLTGAVALVAVGLLTTRLRPLERPPT